MRILVVAATEMEIAAIRPHLAPAIDVLVTGIGMVATAARCARAMASERYDLALNVGLCGSFDRRFAPGSVVHVISDRIAELGAEDGDLFRTFPELNLDVESSFENPAPPAIDALRALPAVT